MSELPPLVTVGLYLSMIENIIKLIKLIQMSVDN
jgi:hypothetical protein